MKIFPRLENSKRRSTVRCYNKGRTPWKLIPCACKTYYTTVTFMEKYVRERRDSIQLTNQSTTEATDSVNLSKRTTTRAPPRPRLWASFTFVDVNCAKNVQKSSTSISTTTRFALYPDELQKTIQQCGLEIRCEAGDVFKSRPSTWSRSSNIAPRISSSEPS